MRKYEEVSVVALHLNLSAATVYRLIKKRELVAAPFGVKQGYRVLWSSVEKFKADRLALFGNDCGDREE